MSVPEAVRAIQESIAKGNYGRADILCRHTMASLPDYPWAPLLLAETALRIGELDASRRWCAVAQAKLTLNPPNAFPEVSANLLRLVEELRQTSQTPVMGGYLLIKCWGYGFWSDVEQVLGALLLAEMTNRIPVVHWGKNSYFTDDPESDAFSTFFAPIAPLTLEQLAEEERVFFPSKWNSRNLAETGLNVWEGEGSRLSGLYFLNRPERVVVNDFFTQVMELLPWLDERHWLFGKDPMTAIRLLHEKYLVVRPEIQAEIDAFITDNFDERPTFAVHVRNLDKGLEDPSVLRDNNDMLPLIDARLAADRKLRLFLMTDSTEVIAQFEARYGDRVFSTDCARTDGYMPLTWRETDTRRRLGIEVIRDTHVAAACDEFLGHGGSSVACTVACLKAWPEGACQLVGDNVKTRRNWLLHDW